MAMSVEKRLAARLVKKDGHLGREGAEMARIAGDTGLSVHTLQSVAKGRRKLSQNSRQLVVDSLSSK